MVQMYNKRVQEKGISPAQMSAAQGNIVAADTSNQSNILDQEFFDFDMVGMANALHHMQDPALAIERLVQRLKPGGTLLIIDFINDPDGNAPADGPANWFPHDHHANPGGHGHHEHDHGGSKGHGDHGYGHGHEHGHGSGQKFGIAQFGFLREQLEKLLVDAGCLEVDTFLMEEPIKFPPALGELERTACFAKGKKLGLAAGCDSTYEALL